MVAGVIQVAVERREVDLLLRVGQGDGRVRMDLDHDPVRTDGQPCLGEGDEQRVSRAMDREERKIKGVTAGSSIPVYRICVGTGEHQVRLKDVRRAVLKCKSYEPTHHKLWIAKKLHPRTRFYLTKTELNTLNERLRTLQLKQGYGIPKGIDPTRAQHVNRRALRGR